MTAPVFDHITLWTFDDALIWLARCFRFVREAQQLGQNRGARVEAIQHWSLGQPGDSWCCEWATMVLDIAFQGNAPIPRGGSCDDVYSRALERHWIVSSPMRGDLFLFVKGPSDAHHIGIVTESGDTPMGIAGNTSGTGKSSNGDGVHEHPIVPPDDSRVVYVHYPR